MNVRESVGSSTDGGRCAAATDPDLASRPNRRDFVLTAALAALAPGLAEARTDDRGATMDEQVVRRLWDAFERRAWAEARGLFDDKAVLLWPVSAERIDGADGIVRVNAIYPEGWTIKPQSFATLADGRICSVVRVDHPPNSFYAVSFFTLANERITKVEEYWSTVEAPPAWRTPQAIPGYSRAPMGD